MGPVQYHVYCLVEADAPAGPCKVGVATNLSKRLSSLQGGNWRELRLAWSVAMTDRNNALNVESHILSRLRPDIFGIFEKRRKLKSEWIDATPEEAARVSQSLIDAYCGRDAA